MTTMRAAANTAWLAPGSRLDRYDLLLQVAEGGMGSLWLARQEGKHGFDRIVAIKTILPKLASDAGFRQMFLDEARVVSRIEHPHVAQVLDLGEERGVLFLVMEWIDGESLIKVGRAFAGETDVSIPVGVLARIMVDACAGLHAAHEIADEDGLALGVVHRDVSPHNLLVGFGGTTKVIDFGIAKARNRLAQDTSVGLVKGKVAYMAPEQALGVGVDRRTDVWSAGASMYRFLAGCVPYDAPEPLAMLRRLTSGSPPTPLSTSVPEPIRLVVERALALEPAKRFATAHDMGAALETAMRDADVYATHEDVAAFMADHLGEGRATRTREIGHAVRESRARMRVELARTDVGPGAGPRLDVALGAAAGPRLDVALGAAASPRLDVALGAATSPRPSGRPTAVAYSRPSGRPTAAFVSRPSSRPTAAMGTSPRPIEGSEAPAAVPVAVPPGVWRQLSRSSRPLVRWVAGGSLLGALLAAGWVWHARSAGAIGVADVAPATTVATPTSALTVPSETSAPSPADTPAPSPAGTPAPSSALETSPVPEATRAPAIATAAPLAAVPLSVHPKDPAVVPTALAEPAVSDRGSSDDLLERARRARRAGRIGEAATLFAAAVEKSPTDSESLTGMAEIAATQGDLARAIALYRRTLAVNPRYLPARLGLADSLWASGQRDEAQTTYRSIVGQFPATLCPDRARERAAGSAGHASGEPASK
jgi:eukaryotic-like serine/threonine-protein kinase